MVAGRRDTRFRAPLKLLVLASVVFASSYPVLAQHPERGWEIFAQGGGSFWNDQFQDTVIEFGNPPTNQTVQLKTHVASSGRLFAGFRFHLNRRESIEGSYSYALADIVGSQRCEHVNCGIGYFPSAVRSHYFAVNYVRALRLTGPVRPFLTAGLGLVYFHAVPFQTTLGTGENGVFEPDPFTVNIGGGIDVPLTEHWLLRVEYRDWLLQAPRQNDFDATGLAHNQVPSIGLVYRF